MRNTELIENYQQYTDKYFLRSKRILEAEGINPVVRYQVFARQNIPTLEGVDEAVHFIRDIVGDKVKIYSLKDGQEYTAKEPIMKIEGKVQDLVDLETVYLGILAGRFTEEIDLNEVRKKARAVKQAARDKPVLYFGARHFHYNLDDQLSKICQEEGFVGSSTDIGAKAWNAIGIGTIPHALILSYTAYMQENRIMGNPTVEASKGFDRNINKKISRTTLVDTFNREINDSIATAKAVPSLKAVRIDTCGENYTEGSREIVLPNLDVNQKYVKGKGVKIASVWAVRRGLDEKGLEHIGLTLSSGFNAEKTAAFMEADRVYQDMYGKPLFQCIGTGSLAKPVMTTSDIVAYFSERQNKWLPLSKKGRDEILTKRLEEIK